MNIVLIFLGSIIYVLNLRNLNAECVPSETTASGTYVRNKPKCAGELLFEDNFEYLDVEKWKHEVTLSGGGNKEFQYYLNNRTNSFTVDGCLHIRPTLVTDKDDEVFLSSGTMDITGQCTDASYNGCVKTGTPKYYLNSIKSAKITTFNSFSFKYGKVLIRARIPSGDWLWPAIWMMPRFSAYGTWPSSGEIDLLEARGNKNLLTQNGVNIGTQQVGSTLHWGPFAQVNQWYRTHYTSNNDSGYDTDFHDYEFHWTSDNISFYVDGRLIGVVAPPDEGFWTLGQLDKTRLQNPWKGGTKMAPFDQKFYLIINLAVGGVTGYFPDGTENPGGKPWINNSTTAYRDFWKGRDQWLPSWDLENDQSDFVVAYIKVYSI